MTIALFSDIHANLPALDAFFKDVDHRKPDAIYCLGDLIGYNVWPNEVIHEIRKRGIATLAGNHDLKVKKLSPGAAETITEADKNYAYAIVGEEEKNYLLTLPAHIRLEFQLNEKIINLLLVHGSPRSVNEYLPEDMEEALLLTIMEQANADMLCFGHSHKPYHKIISISQQDTTVYKHAINIGSIGKPKDGDSRACYVLLHINTNSSALHQESVQVEFIRVKYDVESAAKAVEESPLPNELADMLRKGF
jgi:predicted phosphodiesterase